MKHGWRMFAAALGALTVAICAGCASGGSYQHIGMDEAERMMESDDVLVVDVRTEEEYAEGHIPGAIPLPIEDIREGRVDALDDKDRELLLYCRTGRRAEDAAALLVELGYTRVYEFGGIVDWKGGVETGLS